MRLRARFSEDDLVPALLFIVLAALACVTPAQNDTWWHLASGREMWETRAFLTNDPFSHTAFGTPLQNHWWLTQLAFYATYSLGGAMWLTLLAGGFALAAVFGSWRLLRGQLEIRVFLLAFLIVASVPEWSVRPQVVSLAFLVLTAHLIARDRIGWLPVVCVVWANSHAMVVFGVVMAGACALEALIWSRPRFMRDAVTAIACAAAPVASPIGWHYWPHSLMTVSVSKALQLQEYRAPLEAGDLPFWAGVIALAAVIVVRWNTLRAHPREDRILAIGAAILAVAAMMASRNVAFFAVIAAPALSRLWPSSSPRPAVARAAGMGAYALVAAAALSAAIAVGLQWRNDGARLGWRPVPGATLQAVRACEGPLFNHLEDGGYLIWALPRRGVFVDSRVDVYPLELLRRSRNADLFGEYEGLFREYRIACAVTATGSPLRQRLDDDPSMVRIHTDAARTVFRRAAEGRAGQEASSAVTGVAGGAVTTPMG